MSFQITDERIEPTAVRDALRGRSSGACVVFEGWVRDHNEGREVARLAYEAYAPLAVQEGEAILAEARERWPLERAVCVHRSGALELEDVAVVVGVSAAHRDAAFEAARYIIDEVKRRLPIWKKEAYADGQVEWVNCRVSGGEESDAA